MPSGRRTSEIVSKKDGKQSKIILKGLSADVDATNECINKFIQEIVGSELYFLNFQYDKKAVMIGLKSPRSKCSCFVSSWIPVPLYKSVL